MRKNYHPIIYAVFFIVSFICMPVYAQFGPSMLQPVASSSTTSAGPNSLANALSESAKSDALTSDPVLNDCVQKNLPGVDVANGAMPRLSAAEQDEKTQAIQKCMADQGDSPAGILKLLGQMVSGGNSGQVSPSPDIHGQ